MTEQAVCEPEGFGSVEVVPHARARQAHQLRLSGLDWDTVAARSGYADGRAASTAVTAYLQKAAVEQDVDVRRRQFDLERARLDLLQAAYWDDAVAGDLHAAAVVLKVIGCRRKLLGLDRPHNLADDAPRTVVIGGTTEEYIAGLRALSEQS